MKIYTNKGITLIALAVTIVVMLILAGISITALTGDNGLIENAIWAAFAQEMTALKEQIEIEQITNSAKMAQGEESTPIFTVPTAVEELPKSLKMEILYIRENMPDDKEPTKEYYIEDLLDYLIDDTRKCKRIILRSRKYCW